MMKGMRIAIVVAVVPLLLGQMCGAPAPTPEPQYGRLDVTPALREACAGFLDTDPEIEAIIASVEGDRLSGLPYQMVTQAVLVGCYGSDKPLSHACNVCGLAIASQVYGQ